MSLIKKTSFESKKIIVFDWDGTIFDSMKAKIQSFSSVVSTYFCEIGVLTNPNDVANIYLKYSGRPRKEIFLKVAKEANYKLETSNIDELNKRLFLKNRTALANINIFPDALRLLKLLAGTDFLVYISSSVPQVELNYFVSIALPEDLISRFSGILGSADNFSKGYQHIDFIVEHSRKSLNEILVIGDDESDFHLSKSAGVTCILVDRNDRFFNSLPDNFINNLDELCNLLNLNVLTH